MAIDPTLASVAFGLASAATWGLGDFGGALASRRSSALTVVLLSQTVGFFTLLVLALLVSEPLPQTSDIVWAIAAGIVGQIGVLAFYRAMSIGLIGIAAPVTGVICAMLPVIVGALTQGVPALVTLIGFALALAGVWFIARPERSAARPEGLGLAVIGGLGFGFFLVFIAQVHHNSVYWPLVVSRFASVVIMVGRVLLMRRFTVPPRNSAPLIVLAGVMDVAGNALFVLAAQAGRLDVAGVLASLYPATTVVLALALLKEKMTRWQTIGIVMALVAIPLIAVKTQ